MTKRIGEELLSTNKIAVTHLCTDSDATGKDAFETVNKESGCMLPKFAWYKDLTHFSRNMKSHILGHKFDSKTFGQKQNGTDWNYKERLECRKALSIDIPERVAITLKSACVHWQEDVDKIKNNADKLSNYIIKCYEGDHSSCQSAPIAQLTGCKGGAASWFHCSSS